MQKQIQKENFNNQWSCPISQQLMNDPVIAEDGFSYQRTFIQNWFKNSNMSPISGLLLSTTKIIPNRALKQTIEQFLQRIKTQDQQNKDQKQIERNIARMREELEKLNKNQAQKKYDLYRLTQQINTIERKLRETIKYLQEIKKKKEEKTKAEQEFLLKAKFLEETSKKQVKINIKHLLHYGNYFKQYQGKMRLSMNGKSVTDQMLQEIFQFDLSRIQKLELERNKITDNGFYLLFQNREWPVLQQIYLRGNKIQNIHPLHKIPNLNTIALCDNELSEASCSYICEHQWSKLRKLFISFKEGLNDKCWQKLLLVMPEKFSKLVYLYISKKQDISEENQDKIEQYCQNRYIQLFLQQ